MSDATTIQNKELLLANNIEGQCDKFVLDIEPEEEAIEVSDEE